MEYLMDLDDETVETILAIRKKDLAEAKSNTSGNTSDDLIAIEIYLSEIESQLRYEKDQRLARSVTVAKLNDHAAINAIIRLEKQDRDDRELAKALAGNTASRRAPNDRDTRQPPPSYDEAVEQSKPTLSKLAGLWVSEDAGNALHPDRLQGDVDMGVAQRVECVACGDEKSYFEVMDAPCGHVYCKECVREHFEKSFHDESMFPPRCCRQPIRKSSVSIFLTRDLIERFDEKSIEFNCTDRAYCANEECLKFIVPDSISNNIGHCQKCNTDTCAFCKQKAHGGVDCPHDSNLQVVLDMANAEGWQRCGRCKTVIDLRSGCYHITCRCGYQFCYLCAAPWKTCGCDQWHEGRLLERARQVADRERRDVRLVREELVTRHNCTHHHWQRVGGGGDCDECGVYYPHFLYRCQQCRVDFCRTCQLNRAR